MFTTFSIFRDYRLTIADAYHLVFGSEVRNQTSDMDFKAEKLKEIFKEMMKTRRKEIKMYQMNKHLIDDAADFINDLEAMKDLRKRIQSDVKKEANRKELSGLFEVFPNGMYSSLICRF
jgi:hypothetical protein